MNNQLESAELYCSRTFISFEMIFVAVSRHVYYNLLTIMLLIYGLVPAMARRDLWLYHPRTWNLNLNLFACSRTLQIDLHTVHVITATETQGRFGNGQGQEFTEKYILSYWRPELGKWVRYRDSTGNEVSFTQRSA